MEGFASLRRVYVELDGSWCAAAMTPTWLRWSPLEPGSLAHATPRSLARLAQRTGNPLAAAFALAATAAATTAWMLSTAPLPQGLEPLGPGRSTGRLLVERLLGSTREPRVAMLGYMPGLAAELEALGARVEAADYDPELRRLARERGHAGIDPEREPGELHRALRGADLVVFSGSSLLDPETAFALLGEARGSGARTALVGATASIHPAAVEELGFDAAAGLAVEPRLCPRLRLSVAGGGGVHRVRGRLVHWLWIRG